MEIDKQAYEEQDFLLRFHLGMSSEEISGMSLSEIMYHLFRIGREEKKKDKQHEQMIQSLNVVAKQLGAKGG